ncbi:unnamed protein product, partial [marine sediment metagenome]
MTVHCATSTTWPDGAVIIAGASGLVTEGADGPTTGTIMGVAVGANASGDTTGLIVPALPDMIFRGQIATGDSGATATTAVTLRYAEGANAYEVAVNSSIWYVNVGDTTDNAVQILEIVDASTAWGVPCLFRRRLCEGPAKVAGKFRLW